jgi:hypothetical protein
LSIRNKGRCTNPLRYVFETRKSYNTDGTIHKL